MGVKRRMDPLTVEVGVKERFKKFGYILICIRGLVKLLGAFFGLRLYVHLI